MSSARAMPTTSPTTDPTRPRMTACTMTNRPTCRRVAPAARSRPNSRTRSVTVIDSVLKMRNAPTNRAIAAMSAVVERKSAVETLRDAARSRGDERTYGSEVRATSRAFETSRAVAPSPTTMSTRLTPSSPSSRCAVRSGTMTVRPLDPTNGPSPSTIPTTLSEIGPSAPAWNVRSEPRLRPSSPASRSVTRTVNASGPASSFPAASGNGRTFSSSVGSTPRIVTGFGST